MNNLKDIGELLTGIGTIVLSSTAIFAFFGYRRQAKTEKLRWLEQLYEKFYEQERYKPVRQRIDFDALDDLLPLLHPIRDNRQSPSQEDRNKIDQFTDYLNFFEWIAFLEGTKELPHKSLKVMFNYYFTRILQIDDKHAGRIVKYIIENDYQEFERVLSKFYAPKTINLFVYGTLKKGGELHEQISIRKARFLGQAKIKGQLFQIADETYPGAIVTDSEDHIMGELFQLRDPLRALYEIDKIEGCDEGLFERKLVDVWFDSKCVKAWSYFYAKPLGASARILSGVFSINPMLKKPQSN